MTTKIPPNYQVYETPIKLFIKVEFPSNHELPKLIKEGYEVNFDNAINDNKVQMKKAEDEYNEKYQNYTAALKKYQENYKKWDEGNLKNKPKEQIEPNKWFVKSEGNAHISLFEVLINNEEVKFKTSELGSLCKNIRNIWKNVARFRKLKLTKFKRYNRFIGYGLLFSNLEQEMIKQAKQKSINLLKQFFDFDISVKGVEKESKDYKGNISFSGLDYKNCFFIKSYYGEDKKFDAHISVVRLNCTNFNDFVIDKDLTEDDEFNLDEVYIKTNVDFLSYDKEKKNWNWFDANYKIKDLKLYEPELSYKIYNCNQTTKFENA